MTDEEKKALAKNNKSDSDGDEVEGDTPLDEPGSVADDDTSINIKKKKPFPPVADEAADGEETDEAVKKGASVGVIEAGELFDFLRQLSGEESRKSVDLALENFDSRIEEVLIKALSGDAVKGVIRRIVGGRMQDGFAAQNELLGEKIETLEKGLSGMSLMAKGADLDAASRTQALPTSTLVSSEVLEDDVLAKGVAVEDEAPVSIMQKGASLIEKGQSIQREKRVAVDGLTDAISERGDGAFTDATLGKLEAAIASLTKAG